MEPGQISGKVTSALQNGIPILTPEWVEDSIAAQKLLPLDSYAADPDSSEFESDDDSSDPPPVPANRRGKRAPPVSKPPSRKLIFEGLSIVRRFLLPPVSVV